MKGWNEIHNGMKYIDSREIEERITYLEDELEQLEQDIVEAEDEDEDGNIDDEEVQATQNAKQEWEEDYLEELNALRNLKADCEDSVGDWSYGATLIREDAFVEYTEDLLIDIGMISKEAVDRNFPAIDWEQTAETLKADYYETEFMGETYLARM